jgi:2-keto-4-pentenoate hydratase/2-oxohepta-3-ene-1,7-dioic acid hydratase in catechol pathway
MASYRLLTYRSPEGPRSGLLVADQVVDVTDALAAHGSLRDGSHRASDYAVLALLEDWDHWRSVLEDVATRFAGNELNLGDRPARPLGEVELLTPIVYPRAIFGAASNYNDHIVEWTGGVGLPPKGEARPLFFQKTGAHSMVGTGAELCFPGPGTTLFWESELGVVIGRPTRRVAARDALDYVAGYVIVNDLSCNQARRTDWYSRFGTDWCRTKSFDNSAPCGPWLTPADSIPDPHDLMIRCWVNDQLMQEGSTGTMYFTIGEQIEYLAEQLTLLPGDIISTGTLSGVGAPKGIFLKPGDRITITIDGLGTLVNTMEAQPAS